MGSIELFHTVYGKLLFETVSVPSPAAFHRPYNMSTEEYIQHCFAEAERVITQNADQMAAFIIEPLVQGAAGILVQPDGDLKHVRKVTSRFGVPLIADEGAANITKTVVSMTPLPNSARLCVVECKYFDDKGFVLGTSRSRHWCRALDIGMRIELTEILSMPLGLEPEDIEGMYAEVRHGLMPPLAAPQL